MVRDRRSALWKWLVNGVVITIPLVITLMILLVVLEFVVGLLSPVVAAVEYVWPGPSPPAALIQLTTLASIVGLFLAVGFVADHTAGSGIAAPLHDRMEALPVLGPIYTGARQASTILLEDGSDRFREVKLVEFPHEDAYMLGFLTGEASPAIRESADAEGMLTIMVPLSPNFTNGFVVSFPEERIHDVDMSVEEAVRAIATLGVASDPEE